MPVWGTSANYSGDSGWIQWAGHEVTVVFSSSAQRLSRGDLTVVSVFRRANHRMSISQIWAVFCGTKNHATMSVPRRTCSYLRLALPHYRMTMKGQNSFIYQFIYLVHSSSLPQNGIGSSLFRSRASSLVLLLHSYPSASHAKPAAHSLPAHFFTCRPLLAGFSALASEYMCSL